MARTAARTATQVRSDMRSPSDVAEEALDAARRLDPVLHFVDELEAVTAREMALRLESDRPLAGVPLLLKAQEEEPLQLWRVLPIPARWPAAGVRGGQR